MKHNLMISCNNYDFAKNIANGLAEYFSMRVFDELELFSFDFAPTTIDELKAQYGTEFIYNKLSKTLLSQCDFENVVFVTHFESLNNSHQFFDKLSQNDFIILIKYDNFSENCENFDNELFSKDIKIEIFEDLQKSLADIAFFADKNSADILA